MAPERGAGIANGIEAVPGGGRAHLTGDLAIRPTRPTRPTRPIRPIRPTRLILAILATRATS